MALIPPFYLDTVVALGELSQDGTLSPFATGFLYGCRSGMPDENGENRYSILLVTNRHVVKPASGVRDTIYARFNRPMGTVPKTYPIPLHNDDGSDRWTVHPKSDADVAVVQLNASRLREDGIHYQFFADDQHTYTRDQAQAIGVSEGDGVFVLGFPLGLAGDDRNYAIVRQGIIARIQDWLHSNGRTFLIDSLIFPGNSGGPVLLKPEIVSIIGTKKNNKCHLIGMVSQYVPYRESAVSSQTGRTRMTFEENSGLGIVVPHDVIQEVVQVAIGNVSVQQPAVSNPEVQTE